MNPLYRFSRVSTALLGFFFCVGIPNAVAATTRTAANLAELKTHIAAAQPGDTIIVANGTYPATATINVTCAGTAGEPITIAAETIGGVAISGSYGITVKSPAAYVVISGFVFTHEPGEMAISNPAHHIRVTRCTFACVGTSTESVPYLRTNADDTEIDHNEFRDKNTLGNMVSVYGPSGSTQVARRVWIHHNYFHDFTPYLTNGVRTNGAETIRYGVSAVSMSRGDGIVEYNLIERCTGDVEIISNKSCGNIYRYNTIINCPTSSVTLRHGNGCSVYGNIFRNTDGLRIYGDFHNVYSNYFQNNTTGINIGSGDADIGENSPSDKLAMHDRPNYCAIAFNTLVSNTVSYKMVTSSTNPQYGADSTKFSNNIILNSATHVSLSSSCPYTNPTWENNYYWGTGNTTGMPATGFVNTNPQLVLDAQGTFRPAADSPAIDSAEGLYSYVGYDMDGQTRYGACTVGADEPGNTAATSCELTPAAVGPVAVPPAVQSHTPALVTPRASIVITGSKFIAVTGVFFGSEPAASFVVNSPTQITAIAPAVPPASGVVSVTTVNGMGLCATGFTAYTPPVNYVYLHSTKTTLAGQKVVYHASADGSPAPSFRWQISTDGGATWKNLNNDANTSGVSTDTLTLNGVTASMNGRQYRYIADNTYGDPLTSNVSTLDVISPAFAKPVGLSFGTADSEALQSSPTLALYVSDTSNHTVQKIHITGTMWVVYQGGMQMSGSSAVFLPDISGTGVVVAAAPPVRNWWHTWSHSLEHVAGATGQLGSTNGTGAAVRFNAPGALATDQAGNLYVADTGNATIRKIDYDGAVTTFAGTTGQRANKDGVGAAANFKAPSGIAFAPSGSLWKSSGSAYIADSAANTIRFMTATGAVNTYAGEDGQPGSAEGVKTAARFKTPTHTLVDRQGNLYIADTGNHVIRTVAADGKILVWAGQVGVTGTTDGDLTQARFNEPRGMDIDGAGNLYIADTGNSTIRKIDASGQVTTLAGKPAVVGWADGDGVEALFDHPSAVALDGYDNLYVADTGNGIVRVIDTYYDWHTVTTLHLTATTVIGTGTTTGNTGTNNTGGTAGNNTGNSGNGGGGGGGAPTLWYFAVLAMLVVLRRIKRA